MNRRTYLAATAGAAGLLAGCVGGGADSSSGETEAPAGDRSPAGSAPYEHPGTMDETFVANGDYPADGNPADGYPPELSDPPPAPDADPSTFETLSVEGETVRLAPIAVVWDWYRRRDARFVDARGQDQYVDAHVYGAVLSPAQRGAEGGGIEGWPFADRVVTYCGCPHHLSSIRAAGLQKAGFSEVYALDEGFFEWAEHGYPMAGRRFGSGDQRDVAEWEITGRVADEYAGEYVWARVDRQYEAAPVQPDGRYRLHLRFTGVTAETTVAVSTPEGTVERPLGEAGSRV